MDYYVKNNDIILHEKDFDLDETLDCGQAFRWKRIESDYRCTYEGNFLNDSLKISEISEKTFVFHNVSEEDFLNKWADYFDLYTDYSELKRQFSEDKTLSEACAFAGGIRLLKQNSWECLISFIISQNNNIPRIKGIVEKISKQYGNKIIFREKEYYTFPTPQELLKASVEDLRNLGLGFRDKRIFNTTKMICEKEVDLEKIKNMNSTNEMRDELLKTKILPTLVVWAIFFTIFSNIVKLYLIKKLSEQ